MKDETVPDDKVLWVNTRWKEKAKHAGPNSHTSPPDRQIWMHIKDFILSLFSWNTNRWILMNFMQFISISDSLQDKNSPKRNICTIKVAHIINTLYSKSPEFSWTVVVVWPVFVVLIWCFWCLWRLTDMVTIELYEKKTWKYSFCAPHEKWQHKMNVMGTNRAVKKR